VKIVSLEGVARLNFSLKAIKYDLVAIILLCIIFFSIASYNLGASTVPTTNVEFQNGQSFYVDFGTQTNVTQTLFLVTGGLNVSVSIGTPSNWVIVQSNVAYPPEDYSPDALKQAQGWTGFYNEWISVGVANRTQYLKIDINRLYYPIIITDILVLNENYEKVTIQSITNAGLGNPNLNNLIDEQSLIQFPSTFTYKNQWYYDEYFYIQTGEQILNHQMPIELTNPFLGKIIISAGIAIWGMNPFGWRIMGVIFATLMIPLMYFFGKKLLGSWIGGFSAAFLLTFDFMHFTMARIAMLDTSLVFFSLASQLCFLLYVKSVLSNGWKTSVLPLFLATTFFALAFSTKWLAILSFVAEVAILLALRFKDMLSLKSLKLRVTAFFSKPFTFFILFLIIAVAIYFASYAPMFLAGSSIAYVFQTQINMVHFQGSFTNAIPGSSPWYSWPLLFNPSGSVPVLFSPSIPLASDVESIIVLLGNPAVWWVGFAAVILLLGYYFTVSRGRNKQEKKYIFPVLFILTFFFIQWVPFIFLGRATFVYYFYSNVPFIALASAFFINRYWKNSWAKVLTVTYFVSVIVIFVLFYPLISGAPASPSTINSLNLFGNWQFSA
jgi:dolichyl-phosphate-mannose-protein mannosyltransferase